MPEIRGKAGQPPRTGTQAEAPLQTSKAPLEPGEARRSRMSPMGKAGAYMGLAFILPVSMVVCYWIGNAVQPGWGGTAGAMIGFAAGLYETYRQAVQIEKR